jgi:hypothetical protein
MNDEEQLQIICQSNRRIPRLILLVCCIDDADKRIEENLTRLFEKFRASLD